MNAGRMDGNMENAIYGNMRLKTFKIIKADTKINSTLLNSKGSFVINDSIRTVINKEKISITS